jgi:hypothetical protein
LRVEGLEAGGEKTDSEWELSNTKFAVRLELMFGESLIGIISNFFVV